MPSVRFLVDSFLDESLTIASRSGTSRRMVNSSSRRMPQRPQNSTKASSGTLRAERVAEATGFDLL